MNQRHASYDRRECRSHHARPNSTARQPLTTTILADLSHMQGQHHPHFSGYLFRKHQPSSQQTRGIMGMPQPAAGGVFHVLCVVYA